MEAAVDPLGLGHSLESIFCRFFSVTDLAVLSGRDKREWGSQNLGVIEILGNSWGREQLWRSRNGGNCRIGVVRKQTMQWSPDALSGSVPLLTTLPLRHSVALGTG